MAYFFKLSPELRNLIYHYYFCSESVTICHDNSIPNTHTFFSIVLVCKQMTAEVEPYLYNTHTIVLSIQEPINFLKIGHSFMRQFLSTPLKMQSKTTTLIVEVSQTEAIDDSNEEVDGEEIWYRRNIGMGIAEQLCGGLRAVGPKFPALKSVELIFWFGAWGVTVEHWVNELEALKDVWAGLSLQFNIFNFKNYQYLGRPCWLHYWEHNMKKFDIKFSAMDLTYQEDASAFVGQQFDPGTWNHEVIQSVSQDKLYPISHTGVEMEFRPYFVHVGPEFEVEY